MSASAEYDVVIVGAGIAGALVAFELASAGKRVCVLEAGPPRSHRQAHVDRFNAQAAKIPSSPWPASKQAGSPTVLDTLGPDWEQDTEHYMLQRPQQAEPAQRVAFPSTYERVGGGTTNHWLGTCMRLLPDTFKLASTHGVPGAVDWPISYDDLESFYAKAETMLGVAGDSDALADDLGAKRSGRFPMPPIPPSHGDGVVAAHVNGKRIGGKTLEVKSTPQARNSINYDNRPACMGNTSCVPICPIQAKYDAGVHLGRALGELYLTPPVSGGGFEEVKVETPAEIRYRAVACRVEVDPESDEISGIRYKQWGEGEPEGGSEHVVTGKLYVLAAHAIETAKLLLMSPWKPDASGAPRSVANSSDQVGRNLMDHICQLTWGHTAEPVYGFRGPLSTSGIGAFRAGPERAQRAAYRIEIGNGGWNWPTGAPYTTVGTTMTALADAGRTWFGSELRTALNHDLTRQLRMAGEPESIPCPESRIVPSATEVDALGIPRPEIHYALTDYTKKGFAEAQQTLAAIFAELGATDIQTFEGAPGSQSFEYEGKTYFYRGAGHIIGTYLMGEDRETSVVDADCRAHDHANLFLLGSGVFPNTGTANPTLTIAALALRAAETIEDSLA